MRGALSELKAAPMVWSAVLLAMVVSQTVTCSLIAIATIIDQDYQGPEQELGIQRDHHRSCAAMGHELSTQSTAASTGAHGFARRSALATAGLESADSHWIIHPVCCSHLPFAAGDYALDLRHGDKSI